MSTKRFDKLESFSNYFKVSNEDIERLGFFDVTLDFDSQLYIDSKLLTDYNAPHFLNASSMLKEQFTDLIRLLRHARTTDCSDMFWKEADKRLTFTELHGTCLGYSSNGIIGKAIGKKLRKNVLTRIWTLIQEGKVDEVIPMLGRPYRITGTVMVGFKNGQKIEFPTANLKLEYEYVYPKSGVYVGYGVVYGTTYKAIINVGTHPTINPLASPQIEIHLFDFEGNLYGKNISVDFVKFIREETKFDSLEELKKQLNKDKIKARKILEQ